MPATVKDVEREVAEALEHGLDVTSLAKIEELAAGLDEEFKVGNRNLKDIVRDAVTRVTTTGQPVEVYTFELQRFGVSLERDIMADPVRKAIWKALSSEDQIETTLASRNLWTSDPGYPYETVDSRGNFVNAYIVIGIIEARPKSSAQQP